VNGPKKRGFTRREFARRAVIASAAASLGATVSAKALQPELQAQSAAQTQKTQTPAAQAQDAAQMPKLSAEGQAEAEARLQTILSRYGSRFSDAQKADLRRLCFLAQPPLDRLRAYPFTNGDGPALYLKPLVEREKKPAKSDKTAASKKPVSTR
jgi:hypothetical protein